MGPFFLRRLSGSTNFTGAVEGIFGRRRGGTGWRAVARDRQWKREDYGQKWNALTLSDERRTNAIQQKRKKKGEKITKINNVNNNKNGGITKTVFTKRRKAKHGETVASTTGPLPLYVWVSPSKRRQHRVARSTRAAAFSVNGSLLE